MANDPLVFVEIALLTEVPDALAPLLHQERDTTLDPKANTVVFYSISNCHPGLAGISFGNFLIKNVVQELKTEMPNLKTFVTLSPVPGFRKWLLGHRLAGAGVAELEARVKDTVGKVVATEVYDALVRCVRIIC